MMCSSSSSSRARDFVNISPDVCAQGVRHDDIMHPLPVEWTCQTAHQKLSSSTTSQCDGMAATPIATMIKPSGRGAAVCFHVMHDSNASRCPSLLPLDLSMTCRRADVCVPQHVCDNVLFATACMGVCVCVQGLTSCCGSALM
jgi:hypothetical protein